MGTYLTWPSSSRLSPLLPFHPSLLLVHGPLSDGFKLALLHDPLTRVAILVLCGELPREEVKEENEDRLKLGSSVDDIVDSESGPESRD